MRTPRVSASSNGCLLGGPRRFVTLLRAPFKHVEVYKSSYLFTYLFTYLLVYICFYKLEWALRMLIYHNIKNSANSLAKERYASSMEHELLVIYFCHISRHTRRATRTVHWWLTEWSCKTIPELGGSYWRRRDRSINDSFKNSPTLWKWAQCFEWLRMDYFSPARAQFITANGIWRHAELDKWRVVTTHAFLETNLDISILWSSSNLPRTQ